MERYKNAILTYVKDETTYWSQKKWDKVNRNLKKWINARDKHFVIDYFDDEDNRLCYAKRLYQCRIECFYEILKSTSQNTKITKIIKHLQSVVSFGCGPAPEVAAYICYVRSIVGCEFNQLNILAVDCLGGWEDLIGSISDLDDNATVQFKTGLLNNKYLQKMNHCDVCIMSYPHAMNFDDIWANLKSKFTLIIFIDQAKGPLLQIARSHDFEFVDFQYNGQKTFFYYIDADYYSKLILLEATKQSFKCRRGIHDINSMFEQCNKIISKSLHCGHKIKISCHESEDMVKYSNSCGVTLNGKCRRNIHDQIKICGSQHDRCVELVDIDLKCGHKSKMFCYDNEDIAKYNRLCEEIVKVKCLRNLHESFTICGYNDICLTSVQVKLPCGHIQSISCNDNSSVERDCMVKTKKICNRGLHSRVVLCSSLFICEEDIECKQVCGHKYTMKCSDDIPLLVNTLEYSIINKCNVLKEMSYRNGSSVKDKGNYSYLLVIDDDNEKRCQELCNVVLECGHRCRRKCESCLNGRLHGRCLEKCSRRLKCGHLCVDYCHKGKCRNCPVNCFKSRLKNVFRVKKKISNKYMPQCAEEFSKPPLKMTGVNLDTLQDIFTTRLYVEQRRCLKMSLMRLQKLFEFYGFLPNGSVPTRYKCYTNHIHRSIFAMTRWIWLEIENIAATSFTEFDLEFERLKEMARLYRMAKEGRKSPDFILPILNKLLVTKFSNELRIDIYKQTSD